MRQTWIDLAMLQPQLATLVACGDTLATQRPEMVDVLRHFAAEACRAKGVRLARQAARLIRSGAESFKETEVRLMLHHAGLPEPELNPILTDRDGGFLGRCDLVYRRARLVIEYEGRHHWQEPGRFRKDLDRVNRLQAHGWRVMRLTQQDLDETTPRWIDDVRQHLATGISQVTR